MSPVAIVTDSSACLPDAATRHAALRVLPIGLVAGGQRLPDGPRSEPRVRQALATGEPVRTVSPSPVDYLRAVEACGDGVVVVTPSADLTVMHRNATLAARLANGTVVVVDTRTAAAAHGLAVMAGLRAADAGADAAGVGAAVRAAAARTRLLAVAPRRGGGRRDARCGGGRRDARCGPRGTPDDGGGDRPAIFEVRDGVIVPVDAPAGEDAVEVLAGHWRAGAPGPARRTAVFHDGDAATASRLQRALGGRALLLAAGPALALHLGPGCVGVAWHEETGAP